MSVPDSIRAAVAAEWFRRHRVEREAEARFRRLGDWMERAGIPGLPERARKASAEEARHATACERLAREHGHPGPFPQSLPEQPFAPDGLSDALQLAYEMVAACCVAETQSTSTLVYLLQQSQAEPVRAVLHEIARDEVTHSQLGWAFVEQAAGRAPLAPLGPLLPRMLEAGFSSELDGARGEGEGEADSPLLVARGVLSVARRRSLALDTTEQVILPGLMRAGIPIEEGLAWLVAKRASAR